MESISEVGLLQPIVIDKYFQIISGNIRFESIKRLGWDEVEVSKELNQKRYRTVNNEVWNKSNLSLYIKKNGDWRGKVERGYNSELIRFHAHSRINNFKNNHLQQYVYKINIYLQIKK